ncbi:hypothetical protein ARMGADRAFT_1093363 [Armillaria gallica]|uniref:Uncharacterized protein n=1 Tax=Armillaria gallica TaxID=47427 RepID=A0A2H3CJ36_ARMGA|nr:hypothetical protein ARMGADRAFT_1093363 [Armillaria gallica]
MSSPPRSLSCMMTMSENLTWPRLGDVLVIEFLLLDSVDCHDLIVELDGELRSDSILFITSFSRMFTVVCPDNARNGPEKSRKQHDLITGLPAADDFLDSSRAPHAGDNDEFHRMVTDVHELKRLLEAGSLGSDFKGGMVDNIPEGALDVWAERFPLACWSSTPRQHPSRGTVYVCCAIDKGDGSSIRQAETRAKIEKGLLGVDRDAGGTGVFYS